MQRGTIVAVVILVVLAVVYFATRSTPRQTEQSPLTIEQVEDLSKIEIVPPSGSSSKSQQVDAGTESESGPPDKPKEKVVLEKREDGWWLTKPVESPAASSVGSKIDELFSEAIDTDALDLGTDKAAYGVGAQSGVELSLYGGGASKPAVKLVIGKEIDVEGTDAKRTFVRKSDDSAIYRAQAGIGSFVRQSVDEFRSDKIVELKKKKLSRLEWKHPDGPTIVVEKNEDSWKLLSPQVDWSLDTGEVGSIASALAGLSADGFADDVKASEIGLKPPAVRLKYKAGETSGTLLVGSVENDGEKTYYAKLADKPFQYEISKYAGRKLVAGLGDIRSKTPRTFDQKAITRVEFPGEDRVVVEKKDGSWKLVRPDAEKDFNKSKLDPKLSTLAELTVKGFPDIEPAKAGLTGGADRLVFNTEQGDRYTLMIGDKVDEESGDRYVKFADGDEVYTVSSHVADKLKPKVDDVVGESKAPGPGKGMGKMGGGGMKKKLRKMQMMRKLKQQMRRKGGR